MQQLDHNRQMPAAQEITGCWVRSMWARVGRGIKWRQSPDRRGRQILPDLGHSCHGIHCSSSVSGVPPPGVEAPDCGVSHSPRPEFVSTTNIGLLLLLRPDMQIQSQNVKLAMRGLLIMTPTVALFALERKLKFALTSKSEAIGLGFVYRKSSTSQYMTHISPGCIYAVLVELVEWFHVA